jgi:hypothetical protein
MLDHVYIVLKSLEISMYWKNGKEKIAGISRG